MPHNLKWPDALLADVVALAVIGEVQYHFPEADELFINSDVDALEKQAHDCFNTNERWARQITNGNKGRDTLYVFMRHWVASMIRKRSFALWQKLPQSFANGISLNISFAKNN